MNIIPDPIELINSRVENLIDEYIDEKTCMQCKKKVNYELYCMSPTGDGPAVCYECSGIGEM